jgi:1-acyl-sn-glycerol-3-phosphate acyltransferase
MLLVMWHDGAHPRVLVKKQLFRGPLGWVLRRLGGVPLDRDNPAGVVSGLVQEARNGEPFRLIIAAEGTRTKGDYWKSGFLRISRDTGLPITLAFFDPPTKTMGFGPTFHPSDDVRADMDLIRAFFADKHGIKPKNATVPRLREEPGPEA